MADKVTMNIDLRNVQEQVEDGVKQAQTFGRKAVLAYAGLWGMAYDKSKEMWAEGAKLVDKAEKRGEELEHDWLDQFNKVQKNPDVKKVVDYVEDQYDTVSKNAKSVVTEVEKFLGQFNPAAERVETMVKDVIIEVKEAVIEGYDEMPAKDVIAMLPTMPKELLVKVREYEVNNKGRVTVMREIDAMLESVSEAAENITA
ncbi:MAG: hypothetical protein M9936_18725 [Caldilinea sp.]|nr:hypothetical protein [Caldilinea sp.]MCB0059060.1 hypothetical protein [Caldilineaceae bacterium]MCB0038915.1 hypothetical protein [Caldilinea sp.]MCB0049555.1 hypothetical protein [Caldilinea sp.]MCB0068575.1 hypothetical protein [Caldilineaceae bacterium]